MSEAKNVAGSERVSIPDREFILAVPVSALYRLGRGITGTNERKQQHTDPEDSSHRRIMATVVLDA